MRPAADWHHFISCVFYCETCGNGGHEKKAWATEKEAFSGLQPGKSIKSAGPFMGMLDWACLGVWANLAMGRAGPQSLPMPAHNRGFAFTQARLPVDWEKSAHWGSQEPGCCEQVIIGRIPAVSQELEGQRQITQKESKYGSARASLFQRLLDVAGKR